MRGSYPGLEATQSFAQVYYKYIHYLLLLDNQVSRTHSSHSLYRPHSHPRHGIEDTYRSELLWKSKPFSPTWSRMVHSPRFSLLQVHVIRTHVKDSGHNPHHFTEIRRQAGSKHRPYLGIYIQPSHFLYNSATSSNKVILRSRGFRGFLHS